MNTQETAHSPGAARCEVDGLAVHAGGLLAIVAPNGAGKSELVRALAGRGPAMGRTIRVLGRPPGQRACRRYVSVLEAGSRPGASTVVQAVRWAAWLRGAGSNATTLANEILDELEVATEVRSRRGTECSEGEQRIASLAMALAGETRVAIWDEPENGLDETHRLAVARTVERLRGEGAAFVVTSPTRISWPRARVVTLEPASADRSRPTEPAAVQAGRPAGPLPPGGP